MRIGVRTSNFIPPNMQTKKKGNFSTPWRRYNIDDGTYLLQTYLGNVLLICYHIGRCRYLFHS